MSVVRSVTFELPATGTPTGDLYDITVPVPSGTMVLSSARVDIPLATPTVYSSIPKSVLLQIGTVVGSAFVVDNDPASNYFRVALELNTVTIGGTTYLSSQTYPGTSFRMNGDLNRQCVFKVYDANGAPLSPSYFSFHFTVVSPV